MVTRTREVVVSNKCQCRKCGAIFTDGGKSYIRRGAKDLSDIIDLSETYEEEYEADW